MTRSRGDGGSNGIGPENEELESRDPVGEELEDLAASSTALGEDDGSALLPVLDAEAGPARPLAPHELLLLADRIERQFAQRRRPVSRLTPRRLWLAGGLFAASAAAAVVGVTVVQRSREPVPAARPEAQPAPAVDTRAEPPPGVEEQPAAPSVVPPTGVPAEPPAPVGQERPAEPDAAEEPGPGPGPVPKSTDSSAPAANPAPRASRIGAAGRQHGSGERQHGSGERQHGSGERQHGTVAADRLAAANSLRSRHRYREALALYLQVIEIAPNGMQASVARVAAAEMQLEQFGDIAGAEHLYREARTQGGELTTEAQFGLSQVARARGDAPGERRALQDFLSRHPESPLAAAAKRRLSTLGEK
jgi:tetratricopeptide (TPR) repeat protein